jgi:hypothetical protein
MSLLDARGWLNDRKGKAVRVEVMLEPTDAYASSVVTLNGLLLFWRDRFPEAGMSDPQGAVAWYAIGAGENDPANYIKDELQPQPPAG